jgi:hypothetical protein
VHLPGPATTHAAPLARRPEVLAALAIALATVALRVYGLGRESLWLDEGFTWRLARLAPWDAIAASRGDVHPPLFVLLVGLLVRMFGDCETTLRAVSVVASCASVLLAWKLARRAFGETAAWGAAMLVALSAFQVRYAQEARAYALLGSLALASADALLASLAGGRTRARVAWAVSTTALLYTHASGAFVVLAELVAVAWWMRRPEGRAVSRGMLLPAVAVVASFLPWVAVLREQVGRVSQAFWIARPAPLDVLRTLFEFAGSVPLMALLGLLTAVGFLPTAARPATTHASGHEPPAGNASGPARVLVFALALVPLLVPFALSLAGPAVYLTRAALPASLALSIVAAAGWAALPSRARALVAVLVVAASLPPLVAHHRNTYKEPWREAVTWLEQKARPGDLVLVTAPWYRDGVFAYYARRRDLDVRRTPLHEGPVVASDIDSLALALAQHPRAWLVRARADDPQGLLPTALAAGREQIEHWEWTVTPVGLTRVRGGVRALEIFCYAAADSSPPPVSSRPQGR